MLNPGLPSKLWAILDMGLWHATEQVALAKMISEGRIRAGVSDRYRCSLCRSEGGISLFDFGPTAVDDWGQFRNWVGWFGSQQEARIAVWLKIDRSQCAASLSDAGTALERHRRVPSLTFIPGVEACHRGAIPLSMVTGTLLIARDNREIFRFCDPPDANTFDHIAAFQMLLPPAPDNSLVEALQAGRRGANSVETE